MYQINGTECTKKGKKVDFQKQIYMGKMDLKIKLYFSKYNSKGELVGPGNFGNQDTLVANTQGSSSLKLADFLGTKVSALLVLVSK